MQKGAFTISSAHSFRSRSVAETEALAHALGVALGKADDPGLVIALDGDLGAGKTVFVKGLASGLGLDRDLVSSPTFVLAQQYAGERFRLHHVDLYRIEHAAELEGIGFDEMLDPPDVAAVEWSARFPETLPVDRLSVRIDRVGPDEPDARTLDVSAGGPRAQRVLDAWRAGAPAQ